MIKPIIYHDIREKKKLEAKLFSKIPLEKRKAISQEFVDQQFLEEGCRAFEILNRLNVELWKKSKSRTPGNSNGVF
jgi:hypothetical protein